MTVSIDVDIDDILWGMSTKDKQKLAEELYGDGYVPSEITEKVGDVNNIIKLTGYGEISFASKLEQLKYKYYSLTREDEEYLDEIFKKYL